MAAFARGDRAAFHTLFRRHAGATLSFLYASTSNREAAEDLLQETFARVCRHRDDWGTGIRGGEGDSFRGWLFAIARNIARDAGRRASVRRRAAEDPHGSHASVRPAAEVAPDQAAVQADLARQLLAGLQKLPGSQREAFVMVRLKELSFEEVASALGTTVAATKMRVARAAAALAEILGDDFLGGAR
jgi:RNA polymerase sigma-70 factor, ECF subfamily